MLILRLKAAGKKITEIETQVTRSQKEGVISNTAALKTAENAQNRVRGGTYAV